MVSDAGLIIVSVISLAGMVLLFTLNNSTWFKKENFKIQKKAVMDENRIKLKKLEKEMGLTGKSVVPAYQEPKSALETGGNLLEVLKNLSGDQIQGLADRFLSPEETEGREPQGVLENLLEFANNNPELAEQFIKGISNKKENTETGVDLYTP